MKNVRRQKSPLHDFGAVLLLLFLSKGYTITRHFIFFFFFFSRDPNTFQHGCVIETIQMAFFI
jgi:hypothetical protein